MMPTPRHRLTVTAVLAFLAYAAGIRAGEHARQVLRHTEAAVRSTGDSAAIHEHASEALKHVDAAKAANSANPETLQRLEAGEEDLRHAVTHARHFNSTSASEGVSDAGHHLEGIKATGAVGKGKP